MRTALIIAVIVIAIAAIWLFGGRQIVLLADGFTTVGDAKPTTGPFVASPGWLNIAETPLELSAQSGQPAEIRIDVDDAGRLTLRAGDKAFALGARVRHEEPYDTVFAPDPGETVTFRIAHSAVAWQTPLELNFMTGKSPSWKRNVYYTLSWRKQTGAELEMVWRYEQWCYDDWGSPMMTREGATGLTSLTIHDAPPYGR
jgi:hypothetical protein